jgi:hypothetical protein
MRPKGTPQSLDADEDSSGGLGHPRPMTLTALRIPSLPSRPKRPSMLA